jgi:hypothetical protein
MVDALVCPDAILRQPGRPLRWRFIPQATPVLKPANTAGQKKPQVSIATADRIITRKATGALYSSPLLFMEKGGRTGRLFFIDIMV